MAMCSGESSAVGNWLEMSIGYPLVESLGGEVQHQAPAYTAGFQPAMRGGGLICRQNVSDPQRQRPVLDLLAQSIEAGGVGGRGLRADLVEADAAPTPL